MTLCGHRAAWGPSSFCVAQGLAAHVLRWPEGDLVTSDALCTLSRGPREPGASHSRGSTQGCRAGHRLPVKPVQDALGLWARVVSAAATPLCCPPCGCAACGGRRSPAGGGVGRVRLACGAGPRPGPRGPFRLLGTGSSGLSRPFGVRLSLRPCPRHLPGKLAVRPVLVGAVPFTLSHTSFVGLQADGWTDRCAQRDGFRQHARGVCSVKYAAPISTPIWDSGHPPLCPL